MATKKIALIPAVSLLLFAGLASGQRLMFNNPIFDRNSADPCILKVGDNYYLTLSENSETELTIFKSPVMTNFRNAETKVAIKTPPGHRDLWASEMHEVDGELYIYFTMANETHGHRMYAIKAENASNPMGNWGPHKMLLDGWYQGGIDGTVMKHNNRKYFVWTAGSDPGLGIFIAPMLDATTTAEPYVLLRRPTEPWECNDGCVNEGPFLIYNKNVSYLIFSGSSTWDPNYSLSWMSIEEGKDPLEVSNWVAAPGPVFSRNDDENVYTTGHAAFTVSPDGTETWMVYHGTESSTDLFGKRIARLEKIEWHQIAGTPIFPRPHGYNHSMPVPSGQTSV